MKRLFALLAALLLALAATVPAAAAAPARPFEGTWVSPDGFDFAAPGCPDGALLRFVTEGATTFTHLGRTTVSMSHCTYLGPGPLDGWFDFGPITLTAANGDTLVLGHRGTFALTPNPDPGPPFASAVSRIQWWVVDGTGRFAGADGSGTGVSFDDMLSGIQRFSLSGEISY